MRHGSAQRDQQSRGLRWRARVPNRIPQTGAVQDAHRTRYAFQSIDHRVVDAPRVQAVPVDHPSGCSFDTDFLRGAQLRSGVLELECGVRVVQHLLAAMVSEFASSASTIPSLAATSRSKAAVRVCASWSPCEKLRRATFIPACSILRIVVGLLDEGPMVATILVRDTANPAQRQGTARI